MGMVRAFQNGVETFPKLSPVYCRERGKRIAGYEPVVEFVKRGYVIKWFLSKQKDYVQERGHIHEAKYCRRATIHLDIHEWGRGKHEKPASFQFVERNMNEPSVSCHWFHILNGMLKVKILKRGYDVHQTKRQLDCIWHKVNNYLCLSTLQEIWGHASCSDRLDINGKRKMWRL